MATCLASGLGLRATAWSQTTDGQTQAESAKADPSQAEPSSGDTSSAVKSDTTTVTVTGKKKAPNDRDVYDVSKDLDAKTGTAADALNKIPGVNVDPSGNVTYHGRNVVVYLNGRPSLMLSGDNRGVALKSMPSAYISTIEVISNPGAQQSSGDGAPIININTQRNMPPGMFGSLSARYSSPAGSLETAFLGITKDKLSITLIGSYLNNEMDSRSLSQTSVLDSTDATLQASSSKGEGRSSYRGPFLMANLQYDLGPNDVLAAAFNYNRMPSDSTDISHAVSQAADGAVTNLFDQSGAGRFVTESAGLSGNYTHYGQKPDETLKMDGSLARSASQNDFRSANTYLISTIPGNTGTRIQTHDRRNDKTKANMHAEYNTPIGDDQLTLGAEVDLEDNTINSRVFGPADNDDNLMVNPLLTDDFRSHQVVSAFYATFQREVTPRWTVLLGLRGEVLHLATNDLTYRTKGNINYSRLNPSLFATYVISSQQKVRFNYTHRQQRPEASDLNPHIVYSSDTSVDAGNPGLKPQESDAIEARYEFNGKGLNYGLRGFWRGDSRTITTVSQIIPDPQGLGNIVTQSTRVNWRRRSAYGVSADVSRQISNKLMFSADATLTQSALRNPQISGVRSATSVDGGFSLNYFFKKGDRIFASYKRVGKSYTGQGYTTGSGQANIQYSRKLTDKFDLELMVDDLFRQTRTVTVIDTPLLQTRFVSSRQSPTFMIGLSRHFSRFGPMRAPAN
ncbi:hypothetical protein ABENE_22625 [Asticcacaulis benevestitus DSM 16100 = ATCC BAA-896]|uniref:Outer membrane protein beta-barrel domain-containing protein n=1 Tax=Asticcacaulis benevestitus DSM 16100 = ATCC BAA-896 TaxID=1121022 RepID=V4QJX1_9CAUL|nr:hypothetical protein ABENE_22625 [Asticcacaulis benevestitus DSM 16100 = ATCC BAA-896]